MDLVPLVLAMEIEIESEFTSGMSLLTKGYNLAKDELKLAI